MYYVWLHKDGTLGATFEPAGGVKTNPQGSAYSILAQYPNNEWDKCKEFLYNPNLPLNHVSKGKQ